MINIKEVLFWIFLVLGLVLLLWNVLGNSPTEFIALVALIFTVMLKVSSVSERVSSISERQVKAEMRLDELSRNFQEHLQHSKS